MSRPWSLVFRAFYRFLRLIDPLIRAVYEPFGIGDTVDLRVLGRRSGRQRRVLHGLLRVGGELYLGHPNGEAGWTRDLEAAAGGELLARGLPPLRFHAVRLPPGPERGEVIRATWRQHPFPGNLMYWLARGHIRAVGTFFRLEPLHPDEPAQSERG